MSDVPLPALTGHDAPFWRGGEFGELRIGWCGVCGGWRHPSLEFCPRCHGAMAEWRKVSGKAVVLAVTVNHQRWMPGFEPPYVVAIVGLAEDQGVRLTTNIIGMAPEDVRIGMAVRVCFRAQDDVWLPLFEPDPAIGNGDGGILALPDVPLPVIAAGSAPPCVAGIAKFEDKVALTGVGASRIGRGLGQTPLALTVEACLGAIDDAGLTLADIDGISAWPGSGGLPGVSSGGVRAVEQVLGLQPVWHAGAQETPGQAGAVIAAMLAVAAGLCRHVLCFTSFAEAARPGARGGVDVRVEGEMAWRLPFGAATPASWIALYASQYFARFGADRDLLGAIAVATRAHAAGNPDAIFRSPLTMAEYRDARMITTPFGLLDCDMPVDGAIAVVVSALETVGDLRHRPVRVEAVGTRMTEAQSWDQGTLTHQPNVFGPAQHLWTRTDVRAGGVDAALIYDGFTFNVVSWLEALGFCGIGEAAAFVGDGSRIGPGGALPLNPHGGHLSAGRTHGWGHLAEAIVQLRGTAGARQIEGCATALVTSGGGIPASCMVLRR